MNNDQSEITRRAAEVRKVLLITLACNIVVSAAKISYGFYSDSVSITADGFHSMFDGVSNIVGFIGIYISSHPPDTEHPYGHRKFETLFTIFIGVMMALTCFEIFKQVYLSLNGEPSVRVTAESFIVMAATLAVNVFVAAYERRMGNELKSEFLIADAQHTRSDIYATAGVIIGLVLSRAGFMRADAVVGAVVGLFVARAGIGILREAADALADRNRLDTDGIIKLACDIDGVIECHRVRTRGTGGHVFVDLHVIVRPDLSVMEGHRIAHIVEERIKNCLDSVVDVVVHIEPKGDDGDD